MKIVGLPMFVLACCLGVFAQSSTSSDSMQHDKMAADSMKHDQMAGKKKALTGCLTEKDGKFLLANAKFPNGVELQSSEDLKPHVGHKVRVTGTTVSAMAGDGMAHDSMGKSDDKMAKSDGAMAKSDDQMSHDDMSKDKMAGDSMGKDKMAGDAMAHDKMGGEHGSMMVIKVSKLEMRSQTCEVK